MKKLAQGSRQGKNEFVNEAKLLAKVQHRNVVNLWGYCTHGDDKLLVYEYVANESLDKVLFSKSSPSSSSHCLLIFTICFLNVWFGFIWMQNPTEKRRLIGSRGLRS